MKVKQAALWVSFRAVATNGMAITADAFFEGQLPITKEIMMSIKGNVAQIAQGQFDQLKAVDRKGAPVIGAPKPQIGGVEILCIQPAEVEVEIQAN